MHRSERLNILLRLLINTSGTTVDALRKKLGISQRSLYRDLKLLKDQGYPVEGEVGRGGGIRLHPSYGLGRIQLSSEQAIGTLLSIAIAEKLGLPLFSGELAPARQKISQAFGDTQRAVVRRLQDRIFIGKPASKVITDNYKRPDSKISQTIEIGFMKASLVEIEYRDEHRRLSLRTIEPHGIFINIPAWYIIAHDYLRKAPRTFRMDRITSAALLTEKFDPNARELFEILVGYRFGVEL